MNLGGVDFLVVVEKRLIKHRGFQRWGEVLHLRANFLLSELGRGMFKIVRTIISCELYLFRSLVIVDINDNLQAIHTLVNIDDHWFLEFPDLGFLIIVLRLLSQDLLLRKCGAVF